MFRIINSNNIEQIIILNVSDQVVHTGPVHNATNRYEYLVLSNWSQYPVIGLARDLKTFYASYLKQMQLYLRQNGFMNFITDSVGSVQFSDWRYCRPEPEEKNLAMDIINSVLFGRAK